MEKKKGIYAGMPYSYYGTPMKESEKTVIFYFCGRSEKWQEKAVIEKTAGHRGLLRQELTQTAKSGGAHGLSRFLSAGNMVYLL